MRLIGFILFTMLLAGQAYAQQSYFIYLQSENQQPFFARIGKDVYSSSASGYAIIPQLKDTTYQLTIGFPNNQFPEYQFNCAIGKKDKGFLVKNFNEKGWGLYNLITAEVIMGSKVDKPVEPKSTTKYPLTSDAFTVMLASVVDDPDLRQTQLITRGNVSEALVKQDIKPEEKSNDVAKSETTKSDQKNVEQKPPGHDNKAATAAGVALVGAVAAKPETKKVEESKKNSEVAKTEATKTEQKSQEQKPIVQENKPAAEAAVVGAVAATTTKSESKKNAAQENSDTKKSESSVTKADSDAQKTVNVSGRTASDSILIHNPEKKDSTSKTVLYTKISRSIQYQNRDGLTMVYIDDLLNGKKDTIRIVIPSESVDATAATQNEEKTTATKATTAADKNEPQFLELAVAPKKDEITSPATPQKNSSTQINASSVDSNIKNEIAADTAAVKTSAAATAKTNCKKMATDKDVSALKSRMVVMKDEDDIVNLAMKSFKSKCFTSDKIKSLCFVFITDQGKYKLMDAAYPFVYDPENFSSLGALLTDAYFVNRFNALVKNN